MLGTRIIKKKRRYRIGSGAFGLFRVSDFVVVVEEALETGNNNNNNKTRLIDSYLKKKHAIPNF